MFQLLYPEKKREISSYDLICKQLQYCFTSKQWVIYSFHICDLLSENVNNSDPGRLVKGFIKRDRGLLEILSR